MSADEQIAAARVDDWRPTPEPRPERRPIRAARDLLPKLATLANAHDPKDLAEIRNAMALFRPDWPEPEMATAGKVLQAAGDVSVREIHRHLGELHRRGLKPDVSWDWFVGVVRKRFGTSSGKARKREPAAAAVGA
jgi:hypothetical protein